MILKLETRFRFMHSFKAEVEEWRVQAVRTRARILKKWRFNCEINSPSRGKGKGEANSWQGCSHQRSIHARVLANNTPQLGVRALGVARIPAFRCTGIFKSDAPEFLYVSWKNSGSRRLIIYIIPRLISRRYFYCGSWSVKILMFQNDGFKFWNNQ